MDIKEAIYSRSPIIFQNFLIGLYGIKLRYERYSKKSEEFSKKLHESEFNSRDENYRTQSDLLRKTIGSAERNTNFYKKYLLEKEITSEDIRNIADLSLFPMIEKTFLKKNILDFVDCNLLRQNKFIKLYTSGTTGSPLPVYTTREYRSNHYAFFTNIRKRAGLAATPKRATLFGRSIIPTGQTKPPFWRYDWSQQNLLLSSYHLSIENLGFYVEKLRSYKPDEIFSYPSSIYEIARYINRNNLSPIPTKLVMTTAETLSENQRIEIERAFSCKVVNQYGCTEMSFFASECEYGVMHVRPEHGFLEVLRDDGSISTEGSGELVATGFVNLAMPVVRYRIGDMVTLTSNKECKCGRNTQILTDLVGRKDDVLFKLDGTPVGRIGPIFKGILSIDEACVIQNEQGDIEIKLIPNKDFMEKDKHKLVLEMQKRVGADMNITVTCVDSLPKGANGKFRAVSSKFKIATQ